MLVGPTYQWYNRWGRVTNLARTPGGRIEKMIQNDEQQDAKLKVNHADRACPVCLRDRAIALSMRKVIGESRHWLETHPHVAGDSPVINCLKQMLTEACDFAVTMLDCITVGRTAPAYTNFRCLLERAHYARYFWSRDNVMWEYRSMARQQEVLSRLLNHVPPEEQEWIKERLATIRSWNARPGEHGKPKSLEGHTKYEIGIGKMPPLMQDWYETGSLYVHPTYMWESNIGRGLGQSEIDALTSTGHGYLCLVWFTTRLFDEITDIALLINSDPPSNEADVVELWDRLIEIRQRT